MLANGTPALHPRRRRGARVPRDRALRATTARSGGRGGRVTWTRSAAAASRAGSRASRRSSTSARARSRSWWRSRGSRSSWAASSRARQSRVGPRDGRPRRAAAGARARRRRPGRGAGLRGDGRQGRAKQPSRLGVETPDAIQVTRGSRRATVVVLDPPVALASGRPVESKRPPRRGGSRDAMFLTRISIKQPVFATMMMAGARRARPHLLPPAQRRPVPEHRLPDRHRHHRLPRRRRPRPSSAR